MSDDYLFDGKGPPPPDIAALEAALGGLAHQAPLDELRVARARRSRAPWLAAGAMVAVAAGGVLWWQLRPDAVSVACAGGEGLAFSVDGAATCDGHAVRGGTLTAGAWLETGTGRAEVTLPSIGRLTAFPHSKLSLQHVRADEQRLTLAHGTLEATVIAPPRLFVVDTPQTQIVDLGCAYRIEVAPDGRGRIDVTSGLVELVLGERVIVVAFGTGARLADPLALPYASAAEPALIEALEQLVRTPPPADRSADAALETVLQLTTINDTLALVHALPLVARERRDALVTTLATLAGRPAGVDRQAVLDGDPAALTAWRTFVVNHWLWRDRPFDAIPGKTQ